MQDKRCIYDFIILSTLPHFFAVYYTFDDIYYSIAIILACGSSICWHKTKETSISLLLLDYFFAGSLSGYELSKSNIENKILVLQLNFIILFLNKGVYLLSMYKILNYDKGHTIYHFLSSCKTVYLAYILNKN